jgi:Spy/CpxP family protein refolding chaperone
MKKVLLLTLVFLLLPAVIPHADELWDGCNMPLMLAQCDPERGPMGGMSPMPHGRGPKGPGGGMEAGRYLEQFRMLRLLELLDLADDQEVEFITRFHSLRRSIRQLDQQKEKHLADMSSGLKTGKISDEEINKHVDELLKLEELKRQKMMDFISEARNILTPQQLGRFMVFQERFEFELLDKVRAFRERQRMKKMMLQPEDKRLLPPEDDN